MRFLVCVLFVLSVSAFSMTKEDAKVFMKLHNDSFSMKETLNTPALCKDYNQMAKVLEKELLHCSGRSPELNDATSSRRGDTVDSSTVKGDARLRKMEANVDNVVFIQKAMNIRERDLLMDKAIKNLRRNR